MSHPANKPLLAALRAAACGAATMTAAFVLVPLVCRGGVPDVIWIGLRVLLAVGFAVWHLSGERPAWVWLGVPVQGVLLAVFFAPVARLNGYALTSFTGALPYTWDMTLWVVGLTAAQYLLLRLIAAKP